MGRSYSMNADYSDEQYVTQMKDMRFPSRQIAHLHSHVSFHVGRAAHESSQGNITLENYYRRRGLALFKDFVNYTSRFPDVKKTYPKVDELSDKIDNAIPLRTSSHEVQNWLREYAEVLTKVGLIQAYDMRDTAIKRFRKY